MEQKEKSQVWSLLILSRAFSRISTSLPRRTSAVPFCCCCSRSCRKNPDLRNDVPLFVFARYCRNKLVHCYCCYYCYYPLLCSLSSGISPCSEVSEELCDPEWKKWESLLTLSAFDAVAAAVVDQKCCSLCFRSDHRWPVCAGLSWVRPCSD